MINKMLVRIKKIVSDKDLVNTAINQLYRLVSGPLMLLFIPLYLTQEEQGYWYTFSSVAALSVFADLGFSNIILQFAAHEFAFLKFKEDGTIYGDKVHLHKLADFFRFSVKWLCKVTLIVFPIIVIAGYFFINQKNNENINWVMPWFIYSISSALVFVNSSLLSFFEGCNSVAKVQRIRFKIAVLTSCFVLSGLFLKIKLFALASSLIASALLGSFLIYKNYKNLIIQLWKMSSVMFYSWKKEFLSLIWRYALSWSSGYFLFQAFVPLAFKYYGEAVAGRVGLSLAVANVILSIANIWMVSKITLLNILISQKDWIKIKFLLKTVLKKSILTFCILGITFLCLDVVFYYEFWLFQRLLMPYDMCILLIAWLLQLIVGILATYLRAHKKEPMVWISIIDAVYVFFITLYIVKHQTITWLFIGFLSSFIFVIPYTLYIFYLQLQNDLKI